jgi:predicted nucleic acid-binding Zn ribbon protein
MSAEPLTECPKCKGSLKRIIGAGAGPIFKGSGFYHTDYKGNKSKNNKSNKPESNQADSDNKSSKDDKK